MPTPSRPYLFKSLQARPVDDDELQMVRMAAEVDMHFLKGGKTWLPRHLAALILYFKDRIPECSLYGTERSRDGKLYFRPTVAYRTTSKEDEKRSVIIFWHMGDGD